MNLLTSVKKPSVPVEGSGKRSGGWRDKGGLAVGERGVFKVGVGMWKAVMTGLFSSGRR